MKKIVMAIYRNLSRVFDNKLLKIMMLLFIVTIIIYSENINAENKIGVNILVIDCKQSHLRKILKIEFNENSILSNEILNDDIEDFTCISKGDFIYKNSKDEWYKGNVRFPDSKSKISSLLILKGDLIFPTLSNYGDKLVWHSGMPNNSLMVTELNTGKLFTLISKIGYMALPSWSPDDKYIAYYYGPTNAMEVDNFSLMIIEVKESKAKETEIAPPSFQTYFPGRYRSPLWSPDGKIIIFESNYIDNKQPTCSYYVMNINSKNLKPFTAWGKWSKDGKKIFTKITIEDEKVGTKDTLAIADVSKKGELEDLKIDLPKYLSTWTWSNDGRYFAFSDDNGKVFIVDVDKKEKLEIFKCDSVINLYWIDENK